ncbi:type II secretion system protein [Candidatus Microgenomates bacterium]|nr:type II secretion system protein [Candidatus Microgenomates bacterium]
MNRNKRAFTIMEILIVMGIISIMIPVLFTVVFAVIRQEARVYALTTVKTQGDFILNSMKFNIRNSAISLHSAYPATDFNKVCTSASSTPIAQNPLVLRDRQGNSFYYSLSGNAVASNSSVLATPLALTSAKVSVSGFSMSCNLPSQYSAPIVTISYTVNYVSAVAGETAASLPYSTKIKLRNQ